MSAEEATAPVAEQDREEWFLGQIESPDADAAGLLAFLDGLRDEGNVEQADAWAELLQDALAEQDRIDDAIKVLQCRVAWHPATAEMSARWKNAAAAILDRFLEQKPFVEHVGFGAGIGPAESVRRLMLLRSLKPGVLCYDKTWGFGVVKMVDSFYAKVEIDFEKRARHPMSFAYAAETLQLLDEDHILVRSHRDAEGMKALVRDDPAEVVRMALRSWGPLTVSQLQELIVPRIVAEADWKTFWDGARKGLKKDNLVVVPARRTDKLELLSTERAYDEAWYDALGAERDLRRILELVEELLAEQGAPEDGRARNVLGDRLAFVVKGAGRRHPALVARAVMAARDLKIGAEFVDVARQAEDFLEAERFLRTTRELPARSLHGFLAFLDEHDRARTCDLLVDQLGRLNLTTLNEAMAFLVDHGMAERVAGLLREAVAGLTAEVELVYWMSRNPDRVTEWSLGTLPEIARLTLIELSKDYSGERLRARNQLRSRLEQPEWLAALLGAMTEAERRETLMRVKESPAWSALDRQSMMGQIIKMYPDLGEVLVSRPSETPGAAARGPVTSERSYRERQAQLEKLIKVDIPQNSKEIAVARSYGDLSENHEFKAAKEMQGILLRRRGELEAMLQSVRPTDFEGFPDDRAGIATGVVLERPDGQRERYYILGAWDQDGERGIISCETRLAKALEGCRAGEKVTVPTEHGEETCTLAEVTGLPDEIRTWVTGNT